MTDHPAKFTKAIIDEARKVLDLQGFSGHILDPFAGVGGVHALAQSDRHTHGIELEPEWAETHPHTIVGDATRLNYQDQCFEAVVTSPPYGNRMADKYAGDAKGSKRYTYRVALGRDLSPNSIAALQWSGTYMKMIGEALDEIERVLKPGGLFLLNVSDHIRDGAVARVSDWFEHEVAVVRQFRELDDIHVPTPRMGHGQNAKARVEYEHLYVFERL